MLCHLVVLLLTSPFFFLPPTASQMPTPQTLKFFESENCSGIASQLNEYSLYELTVRSPRNTNSVQVYGFWRFLSSSDPSEKTYRLSYEWDCFPTAGLRAKYDTFIPYGDKYMDQEALYLYSQPDFEGDVRIIQNDEVNIGDNWAVKSAVFTGSSEWSMYRDVHFRDFFECWQPKYNHPNYINGIGFTLLPIHYDEPLHVKSVHKKCLKPSLFDHQQSDAAAASDKVTSGVASVVTAVVALVLLRA